MPDASPYSVILGRNISAARGRAQLSQGTVAARMRALGHTQWQQQTVASTEKGRRRLMAEEVMALASVLDTSISALMRPTEDDDLVRFPSGAVISARSVALSAVAHNDHAVTWDGDKPAFSPDSGDVSAQIIVTPRIPQGGES